MSNALKKDLTQEEKSILKKSFRYCLLVSWSSNAVVQFARNFALSIKPGLDVWLKDDPEEKERTFVRHCDEFYNTNMTTTSLITGIVLAMEKERAEKGTVSAEAISSIKASLLGPTAGIGDSIFFNCYRVIVAGVAISLAAGGNILGPLFFAITFAGGRMLSSYIMLYVGYNSGTSFITKAFESGAVRLITDAASAMGAIMVGALVATNVSVKLIWVPNVFGATVDIQGILDSIMPGLLSIVLWAVCIRFIRKGTSPIKIIFSIIIVCIILSFFSIV